MNSRSGRVLVMGCDNRSFLSVIRSLGRGGLHVHVTGAPINASALQSRYVAAVHHLPVYSHGDKTWLYALIRLLEENDFDLVIPCNDQSAIPLQLLRSTLGRFEQRLCILDHECFAVANDKQKTWNLARQLLIPVPREMDISDFEDLKSAAKVLRFPLVVKPRSSFTENLLDVKQAVKLVNSELELVKLRLSADRGSFQVVQEFFAGVGVGIEVLCKAGEVLVAFQHERVHEARSGGGSTYRKSVPLHPEMLDAAKRLMAALHYTGVCMVEFRFDRTTGNWVLLELNGRFWGSLPLAIAAGVDFPLYLYDQLRLARTNFPQDYKLNLFCRNSVADLEWLVRNLRHHPFSTLAEVLLETRHALLLRERNDTLVCDDAAPAYHELRLLLTRVVLRGIAVLPGSRRWMRRKIKSKMGACRTVLLVCKGNICRSPFAAGLLTRIAGRGLRVVSCGFYPPGRESPVEAIEAARDWGVDMQSHRSAIISESNLQTADIVLVFDFDHVATVRTMFPAWAGKTVLLGAADNGPLEIPDPFGKSVNEFREVYGRINTALRRIVRMLAIAPETNNAINVEAGQTDESYSRA